MNDTRKLEKIAADLDDLSVTLEEIKEDIKSEVSPDAASSGIGKLDQVQSDMERAVDAIEASLEDEPPAR